MTHTKPEKRNIMLPTVSICIGVVLVIMFLLPGAVSGILCHLMKDPTTLRHNPFFRGFWYLPEKAAKASPFLNDLYNREYLFIGGSAIPTYTPPPRP